MTALRPPPVLRSIRWRLQVTFCALAVAVVVLERASGVGMRPPGALRVATTLGACGAALVIGDEAARTVESASRYRSWGAAVRVTAIILMAALGWTAVLAAGPLPVGELPLRLLATEAFAWLAGAALVSLVVGSAAVVPAVMTALILIQRLPNDGRDVPWLSIAVAACVASAWALRDPAARRVPNFAPSDRHTARPN